jgi:hypothetical protein
VPTSYKLTPKKLPPLTDQLTNALAKAGWKSYVEAVRVESNVEETVDTDKQWKKLARDDSTFHDTWKDIAKAMYVTLALQMGEAEVVKPDVKHPEV